jgi:glycosyltransferase 2 family protein
LSATLHALGVFFHHLAAVGWTALGIGLGFHVLKLVLRSFAWRTILSAAYPGVDVPRRGVLGAYLAGVGVNAITPARAGDAVKLYLVKRRIPGSTYPTLATTLIAETVLDLVLASVVVGWALAAGIVPGVRVYRRLPAVDWGWPLGHLRTTAIIAGVLTLVAGLALLWWAEDIVELRRRLAAGLAILRQPRRYVTGVLPWQLGSWACRLATVYWLLRAFHVKATAHNVFAVQAVQSISTLLPFSPGGIGTEQGLLIYAFRGQVSGTLVLSFSVGMHVAVVVVNLVLGFAALFLMMRTLRWRRAVVPEEEPASG